MSLIIENKEDLNALANAIIGANGSNTQTSATKSELEEMINNIIPEKAKFASGTFTPTVDITKDNGPWIDFSLGTDNDGNLITPDLILMYQPYSAQADGNINATIFTVITYGNFLYSPTLHPNFKGFCCSIWRCKEPRNTTSYTQGGGTLNSFVAVPLEQNPIFMVENQSFKLGTVSSTYPFLAGQPIVWLQIKF